MVQLSFEQAVFGTTINVVLHRLKTGATRSGATGSGATGSGATYSSATQPGAIKEDGQGSETLEVKIPPGVTDGQRIRVKGKGHPGVNAGPAGDLYLVCKVAADARFSAHGPDIYVTVPVTISEAVLGAKIDVPTLDGEITMTLPPGTAAGSRLRLKGRGGPVGKTKARGDQYVTIQIKVPKTLTDEQRQLFNQLQAMEKNQSCDGESIPKGARVS